MADKIFVNLPVTALDRSIAFYEAIGGIRNAAFSNEQAARQAALRHTGGPHQHGRLATPLCPPPAPQSPHAANCGCC